MRLLLTFLAAIAAAVRADVQCTFDSKGFAETDALVTCETGVSASSSNVSIDVPTSAGKVYNDVNTVPKKYSQASW